MKSARVLAVCYGNGHIAMVLPVLRALRSREPGIHIDLLALTTAAHEARRQGFTPLGYRDFAHSYDAATLLRHAAPLLADTRHPLVDPRETVAYLGINLEELERRHGYGAARRYAQFGRAAFLPLDFMRRVFRLLSPDLLLTTNSPRSEQAAIEIAAERGVPSLCMVDLFSPEGCAFLKRRHHADVVTTLNEHGKRNLVRGAVPATRIHVTGNPAFDSLADTRPFAEDVERDRRRLGWEQLKVILWAGNLELAGTGTAPAGFPLEVERRLRHYIATHPDSALVIRYHPNQLQHFEAGTPHPRIFWSNPHERHPNRDIMLADLVLINGSTMGLQAALAGKSVLSMDNAPSRRLSAIGESGIALGVADFEALEHALEAALEAPFRCAFSHPGPDAAGRVADLAEGLLLAHSRRSENVDTKQNAYS